MEWSQRKVLYYVRYRNVTLSGRLRVCCGIRQTTFGTSCRNTTAALVTVNVSTFCFRCRILVFQKVNWAVFRTLKSSIRNTSNIGVYLVKCV